MQFVSVDDLVWLVGEKGGLEKLMAVVPYYAALGLPFAWHKFKGQNLSSSSLHSWQGPFDRLAGCNQWARRLIPRWNFSVRMPR